MPIRMDIQEEIKDTYIMTFNCEMKLRVRMRMSLSINLTLVIVTNLHFCNLIFAYEQLVDDLIKIHFVFLMRNKVYRHCIEMTYIRVDPLEIPYHIQKGFRPK